MDIALDDMLTILDEHYNNMKTLDTLNQELFQLQMADKETIWDWGIHLSRHLQALAASFPNCFSPDHVAELKWDCFYGTLPKRLKTMVAYLKASPHEKTYSDSLQAAREAEKEESMELSWNPQGQVIDNTAKPETTSFFLLQNLKGNQPVSKMVTVHLAHLEEESANEGGGRRNWGPWWYQQGHRRVHGTPCMGCEGCPSGGEVLPSLQQLQALYLWLPASENLQRKYAVKLQGDGIEEGSQTPQVKATMPMNPHEAITKA